MEQKTNYEQLLELVEEDARQVRAVLADRGVLLEIKQALNKIFGHQHNQIKNIDAVKAIERAFQRDVLASSALDAGRVTIEEMRNRVIENLYYEAIVHFPEIHMENSLGDQHTIYDLYVLFGFDHEGRLKHVGDGFIKGLRATGTGREVLHSYVHSHLGSMAWDYMMFQPFCTGTGPINGSFLELQEAYDKHGFELFCYHLRELVKWESLEGTPFISFDTLKYLPAENDDDDHDDDEDEDSEDEGREDNFFMLLQWLSERFWERLKAMPPEELRPMINISLGDGKIVVASTRRLEEFLASIIASNPVFNDVNNFSVVTLEGGYMPFAHISRIKEVDTNRVLLNFQGRDVRIKIIDYENKDQEYKKYPNPEITESIRGQIAERINKYWFCRKLLKPCSSC